LVPTGLTRQAHGSPHSGSDGCSLPGIATNGSANSPNGGAAAGAAYRPALLGWCSRLRRVHARLPLRPLMASTLVLLELLLTLPLLRVGKDLCRRLTDAQADNQYHAHRHHTASIPHVSSSVIVHVATLCLTTRLPLPGQRDRLRHLGKDGNIQLV